MNPVESVPLSPQEITAAWLAEVLDIDVSDFSPTPLAADRANLGELVRIDIAGRGPLVAKFAADRPQALAAARRSGLFAREVRFYADLAPTLGSAAPPCHVAHFDESSGRFVLLLDFVDGDADADVLGGIGPDRTRAVLATLADLHERGRAHAEVDWLQPITYQPRIDNLRRLVAAGWPMLTEICGDRLDPSLGDGLVDRLSDSMQRLARLPQTVVHGDAKPDNMAIRSGDDDTEVTLLDWQAVGSAPPAWDVAYAMMQCLTIEDRRAHGDALLAAYDGDLRGYEDALPMGLVVAAALPVLGDPREPRVAALARATALRTQNALAHASGR